jgi:large subunit ribosomal protein L6
MSRQKRKVLEESFWHSAIKMKEKELKEEIEIPEGVEVKLENGMFSAKGAKGECKKSLIDPKLTITVENGKITLSAKKPTKKQKTKVGSFKAHIKNLMRGAAEGHVYKMKICSGHFPMNVSVSGKEFVVKNFLGEKQSRVLKLKEGAEVKVEGEIITIEGCSKEIAGQIAADIEKLTKVTNRDLRIFQDGIYITEKDGKEVR